MRVLFIDGSNALFASIKNRLFSIGCTAGVCASGAEGLDEALSGVYDAAVISSSLPDCDSLDLLRRLREENSSLHVLLLTRPDSAARVSGFNAGADLCLSPPIESAELFAALEALLRRRNEVISTHLDFGDISLNAGSCLLTCGERRVRLNSTELELMRQLLLSGENLVSKESLLVKIWGYDSEVESGIVETYISFLRKKLRRLDSRTEIETVWRRGYKLTFSKE